MAKLKSDEPTLLGIIFTGMFGVLLGLFLAIYTLSTRPVVRLEKMPEKTEELDKHTIYWLKPNDRGRPTWRDAREELLAGSRGIITLTESDLNQWARNKLNPRGPDIPTPPPDAEGNIKMAVPEGTTISTWKFFPQNAQFKLDDTNFIMASDIFFPPIKLMKGRDITFMAQAKGKFVKSEGSMVFHPSSLFIGHCAVPQEAQKIVWNVFLKAFFTFKEPQELSQVWTRVSDVKVEESRLILTIN